MLHRFFWGVLPSAQRMGQVIGVGLLPGLRQVVEVGRSMVGVGSLVVGEPGSRGRKEVAKIEMSNL